MEKLIFPGHIGKLEYIMPALKVYVDADDWVKTADYVDREFAILKANGLESEMKEDKTDYTKDAEIPRYFGFVKRKTPGDVTSDCRITDLGKSFYNAVNKKRQDDINETIMTAFETVTFGKNNDGCPGSNTRLEAPNILLIAALMLDGVTRQEYAGVLYEMLKNNAPIVTALVKIKMLRESGIPVIDKVRVDNKVVPFLVNVHFLEDDKGMIKLSSAVKQNLRDRISKLPPTNDLENLFPDTVIKIKDFDNLPLQKIVYGAPGTGKSHSIDKVATDNNSIRTTFHPDTDYATFVGAYKPQMVKQTRYELGATERVVKMTYPDNELFPVAKKNDDIVENKVEYAYEPQVFLKAYVEAWRRFIRYSAMPLTGTSTTPATPANDNSTDEISQGDDTRKAEKIPENIIPNPNVKEQEESAQADTAPRWDYSPFFLIIEEINRGNCAQIFGDIFQLLDRDSDTGFSAYAINPESSISKYLDEVGFYDLDESLFFDVTKRDDEGGTKIVATKEDIRHGVKLVLPPNLYIWATMNTSDQSLFPIDSAFKRRWDWEYVPIKQPEKKGPRTWKIKADGHWCYWWEFLQAINEEIEDTLQSEDKQLGYFFAKPKAGKDYIDAGTFVSKVVFYLWNDVFKDEDNDIFKYEELQDKWKVDVKDVKENLRFRSFVENNGKAKEDLVHWFINNLLKKHNIKMLDDANQDIKTPEEVAYMRKDVPSTDDGSHDGEGDDQEAEIEGANDITESETEANFSKPEYGPIFKGIAEKCKADGIGYGYVSRKSPINSIFLFFDGYRNKCYIPITLNSSGNNRYAEVKLWISSQASNDVADIVGMRDAMREKAVKVFADMCEGNNMTYKPINQDKSDTQTGARGWKLRIPDISFDPNQVGNDVETIYKAAKKMRDQMLETVNEVMK